MTPIPTRPTITVDLITAESWLESIGDRATMMGTITALAARGVPVCPVAESTGQVAVIGGGAVLGNGSHLRQFQPAGSHVLNAVQACPGPSYDYLREYRMVSVRDAKSAAIIGIPSSVVPCPATLIEPCEIHKAWNRSALGRVVVHRDPICESIMKRHSNHVLVVDPQVERNVPWSSAGEELRITSNPQSLAASIRGAAALVCRSLHLGILAMTAGVPFVCMDTGSDSQSEKMRSYWSSRGMTDVMYDGDDPVGHAIGLRYDWKQLLAGQRAKLNGHFDRMAALLLS